MRSTPSFAQLSSPRQALIRIMQSVNYGSILNLTVVDGELSFNPPPEVLVDIRLDEDLSFRTEMDLVDFILAREVCRLFAQIDALKNGGIERIVVHGGLPRRVTLRSSLQQENQ
jgi:hypothetical protein